MHIIIKLHYLQRTIELSKYSNDCDSLLEKPKSESGAQRMRKESAEEQRAEAKTRLRNCCPQTSQRIPDWTISQSTKYSVENSIEKKHDLSIELVVYTN